MNLTGHRCLVIDDSRLMRRLMHVLLEDAGAQVLTMRTAEEGLLAFERLKPDVVVLDLKLPDNDGINLLPLLKRADPAPSVIVSSVRHDPRTIETAFLCGADAYLPKPFLATEALQLVSKYAGATASVHPLRLQ